jgi:hypothetical protein
MDGAGTEKASPWLATGIQIGPAMESGFADADAAAALGAAFGSLELSPPPQAANKIAKLQLPTNLPSDGSRLLNMRGWRSTQLKLVVWGEGAKMKQLAWFEYFLRMSDLDEPFELCQRDV